jgi:type IV pilus assembly protein PilY1
MARIVNMLQSFAANRSARWVGVPLVAVAALATFIGQSQTTIPPSIDLAAEPLYARGARAKPTLTLALSVEFPTVGAQYVNTPGATSDDTYAPTTEYLGYFDTASCYLYNNGGTAGERYFYRTGAATNRTCAGAGFSGNFMNWATSSAIDILRYGLTGGDRVVDTANLTVLQRAVLPNTSVTNNFWNGSNFPSKILRVANIAGAVPTTMLGAHTGDVFVANCLNRVHFGTQATGNCASPGNNSNLGVTLASTQIGPVTGPTTGTLAGTWTNCGTEATGTCTLPAGTKEVAYGTNNGGGGWITMPVYTTSGSIACSNNMTGTANDPKPGQVKACYYRAYAGAWSPTVAAGVLTADSFFYSRVRVCESDGSGNLTDPRLSLCLRYPNGNYKPVGNLQKYSDRVRVAAFGYLNNSPSNPQRYGGVLRAPMKYVGPKSFDANFSLVSGASPNQEWNESTGVFERDPDSGGGPNSGTDSNWPGQAMSGVANYLNQFGRTGTFGQYKTYDPVGELYYEAVRYLQGMQPTDIDATVGGSAFNGITDAMRDGFPAYTSWTDPHPAVAGMTDYSCVKNNIVGIGDVNTHNDRRIPGNPNTRTGKGDEARGADVAANRPDFHYWTSVVGGFESNNAVAYTDGEGVAQTTANANPNTAVASLWGMENTNIGADNASYYMAGVAYWANTHDIRGTAWSDTAKRRPGMRVTTYWLDVNEYGQQTDPAVHRARNQFYLAAKYGGFKDVTGTGNPFLTFPAGSASAVVSNENWERASSDPAKQEAKNYFLSSSAQDVLDALDQIFENIAAEANSIAGGAISTQRLTTSGGLIYQAQFDPADWSGDLVAYPVSVGASSVVNIGTVADSPWKNAANESVGAAGKLDERDITTRKIYVGYHSDAATPVFSTAEFKWSAGLSTVVKNVLKTPPGAASAPPYDSDTIGENRLNYLRGDRSLEAPAGTFRKRGSRLGDIVNSGVAFSGPPLPRFADTKYNTFVTTHATRTKTVFVGANDGMMHAFNADTGDELFAYIPSWLLPKLNLLTAAPYTHRSYADGTPVVAEAKVGADSDTQPWKTVLVAGTGGGGQGVFALDVSDPTAFADDKVMWEFSDRDDAEMGNVIGRPQILKLNVNAGTATPSYKYFAVVTSGVNNYKPDDYTLATGDANYGKPALFLLDLSKAKTDAWLLGTNYFKVRFPLSVNSMASGLANFTVRLGAAEEVTYLYAGDFQGNLWKLDFTQQASTNWNLDALSSFKVSGIAMPMFVAQDAAGNRQPITMDPALVFGPNRSIIVSFGTGKFLEVADISGNYRAQSVYALFDNNTSTADSATPAAAISGRGRMNAGTVTASGVDVAAFTWGRPLTDADTSSRAGWYFDFFNAGSVDANSDGDFVDAGDTQGTGERQISTFGIVAGRLVFGTVIPALNSCDNGDGNLYIVDLRSGDATSQVSTVGILGEPFLAQVGASTLTGSDTTGRRNETSRYQIILQGSAGLAAPPGMGINVTTHPGRLSWREISNYQELRNAP